MCIENEEFCNDNHTFCRWIIFTVFILVFVAYHQIMHTLLGGVLTHACVDRQQRLPDNTTTGDVLESWTFLEDEDCPVSLECAQQGLDCFRREAIAAANITGREGHVDKYGFDNLGSGFVTLFSATTMDNWQDYVNTFREATNGSHPWWYAWASMASFVILSGLCIMNVLLAAIAFSYIETRREFRRFEDKKAANDAVTMALLADPMAEKKAAREQEDFGDPMCNCCGSAALTYQCRALMQHQAFSNVYLFVIIFNIVCMAMESHDMDDRKAKVLLAAEYLCNALYIFEAAVKIQGMSIHKYLGSKMNQVDFVIVVSAVLEMLSKFLDVVLAGTSIVQSLRPLRIFRLFRVARIARIALRSARVRSLLAKAFSSIPAVLSLCFLILYILLVVGLAGQQIFGRCLLAGTRDGFPSRPNFNSMGDSALASFLVLASDDWTGTMFNYAECSVVAWPFFMMLVFIMHFILADLFVAVFIENFQLENDEKRNQQIQDYLKEASEDGHGVLDIKGRMDTANAFLSTKTKTNHVGFDSFVSGAVTGSKTNVLWTGKALGVSRSANAVQRMIQNCGGNSKATAESGLRYANPLMRESTKPSTSRAGGSAFANPLVDSYDARAPDDPDDHDGSPSSWRIGDGGGGGRSFDDENDSSGDSGAGSGYTDSVDLSDEPKKMRNWSLGLFDEYHTIRLTCQNIMQHHLLSYVFEVFVIICVLMNATAVITGFVNVNGGHDADHRGDDVRMAVASLLHIAALVGFVIELSIKVIADGFCMTPQAYLSYPGQVFEFCCLLLQLYCVAIDDTGGAKLIRILITFRLLYLFERTKVIMGTIEAVLPAVLPFFGLVAATLLTFGILGMTLFMGKLYRCVDGIDGSTMIDIGRAECEGDLANASWVNRPNNFDNIFDASETLFIAWSLRGWTDMLFWAMDSPSEIDDAPVKDESFLKGGLFYVVFIMWTAFMMTKLFTGMLADFFSANSGKLLMTDGQRDWQFVNLVMFHLKPIHPLPDSEWRLNCFNLVSSVKFQNFIHAVVMLSTVELMVSSSFTAPVADYLFLELLWIFVYFFEASAKVAAYGVMDYWVSSQLELFVLVSMVIATCCSMSTGWVHLQVLQSLRLLRVTQVMARFAGVRKLYYVVKVTLPELINLCFCILILLFVSSVVAEELCGGVAKNSVVLNDMDNFDDLVSSMRLLFQITAGQSFREVTLECEAGSVHPAWIRPFFFWYYALSNIIFLSLFVALLLDNLALMGSDDFSISDVDVELFRETWLEEGLQQDERLPVSDLRGLVSRMRGTFSFIHKSDPFWFNRLMLELGMSPEDENADFIDGTTGMITNAGSISFSKLLRALCHMRFSSRCLSLEDEVAKQAQLRVHLNQHAAAVIHVGVQAWRARRNPPAEIVTEADIRRWQLAVWCAQALQMSAVIATQRITPENLVAESLNDLQRLVDRSKDTQKLQVLKQNNARSRTKKHQAGVRSGTSPVKAQQSLRDFQKGKTRLEVVSIDSENGNSSDGDSQSDKERSPKGTRNVKGLPRTQYSENTMQEALSLGNQNSFMTRRTHHKNTGNEDRQKMLNNTPAAKQVGERYSSGVVVLKISDGGVQVPDEGQRRDLHLLEASSRSNGSEDSRGKLTDDE